jgi:phosphatidate phosphatase APP1
MGIHGTFVVPTADGGYQTVHTQAGEVTAVSTSAITVESEDGYAKTYTVTAETVVNAQRDGIGSIEVGDTVRVLGVESDGRVTAVKVSDRTRVEKGMEQLAPPAPDSDESEATPSSSST